MSAGPLVTAEPFSPEAFAPFGTAILPPAAAGERAQYGPWLEPGPEDSALQVHVNWVEPSAIPLTLELVERHPHAAQAFVPLDVARYLVIVLGATADGGPDVTNVRAFFVPGTIGVIYRTGVWHTGATVLDRRGHFLVLMRRRNDGGDDEFSRLDRPLRVADEPAAQDP